MSFERGEASDRALRTLAPDYLDTLYNAHVGPMVDDLEHDLENYF